VFLSFTMNITPKGDNLGGAGCDDPHVRICERPMQLCMGLLDFARFKVGIVLLSQINRNFHE
ncbi:hypothetical protein, partial [Paenibacillus sp. GCM10012303]|uniref:hypothetical protein n=1 Tax=Paenibacillus sp. GCM10012303 TaxID=3317340 RepID=UPI003606601A